MNAFSPCMPRKLTTSNRVEIVFHYLFWLCDESWGKMRVVTLWLWRWSSPSPQKQTILSEPDKPLCHCLTKICSDFADRLASVSTVIPLSACFTCVVMALPTPITCSQNIQLLFLGHSTCLVSFLTYYLQWFISTYCVFQATFVLCLVWFVSAAQWSSREEATNVI